MEPISLSLLAELARGKRVYLVKVAKAQRTLIRVVLVSLLTYVAAVAAFVMEAPEWVMQSIIGVYLLVWLVATVLTVILARAVRWNIVLALFAGIIMLVPNVGLLVMFLVNQRATRQITGAGVRVGVMGVSRDDLIGLTEGACTGCGFDLRGLTAPSCPKCSKPRPSVAVEEYE